MEQTNSPVQQYQRPPSTITTTTTTQPQQQQQQQRPVSQYPYQQMQQQFQIPAQMMPAVHVSSRGMWSTKLTFRIISMCSCLVLIGISIALAVTWTILPLVELVPPAAVALIWNFSESICLCVRRGHRGIHPGAVVAIDLLLWLGYIVGIVFFALYGLEYGYYSYYDDYYYDYGWSGYSRALLAFGVIEIITHLTLFIIACYETSVRNRNQQVVYVQPGPNGAVMYPPANYQVTQVYQQPVYPQVPPPTQQPYQYYVPPQDQFKNELPSDAAPISPTHTPVRQ